MVHYRAIAGATLLLLSLGVGASHASGDTPALLASSPMLTWTRQRTCTPSSPANREIVSAKRLESMV